MVTKRKKYEVIQMEEDIKILEKKLKQWEPYKNIKFPTPIEREISKENRAIENLITDLKELKNSMAIISEICVDESKCHITSREAVEEIRKNIFWKAKGEIANEHL